MKYIFERMHSNSKVSIFIILLVIFVSILIFFIPLDLLEYLSLNIVGEPPINGRLWMEGVWELGGEIGMKSLAITGFIILGLCIVLFLNWRKKTFEKRNVSNFEVFAFFGTTIVFLITNILIGYAWWDPNAFLGIGPMFFPSIISLIIIGLIPELFRIVFKFNKKDFSISKQNLHKQLIIIIASAFGYGAVSTLWHCCSFYNVTIVFFFFVIKLVQLWGMASFFYKWGLKMFINKTRPFVAYVIISLCFGFSYPWHTIGFAITFTIFGLIMCEITRRTDSYHVSLFLLYFAYIFHAGLAWNGPEITLFIIIPISICICCILLFLLLFKSEKFEL
ncbi:MAG: hypothetical protein ACTSRG_21205 [Candidatus Helarchaeota archaeon]